MSNTSSTTCTPPPAKFARFSMDKIHLCMISDSCTPLSAPPTRKGKAGKAAAAVPEKPVMKITPSAWRCSNPLVRTMTREEYKRRHRNFRKRNTVKKYAMPGWQIVGEFHRWEEIYTQGCNSVYYRTNHYWGNICGPIGKLP